jgi:Protein of unknown function, DUF536
MSDIHTIDIQSTLYFSKEEITEKTGISPHTLQNWINADKPINKEFETLRGGKRTYSTVYIEKIFTNANRAELVPKLQSKENLISGQPEVNQQSTNSRPVPNQQLSNWQSSEVVKLNQSVDKPFHDEVIKLVNLKWEASVAGKDEVISLLKEQLESTKQQIDLKDGQITDLSRNLNQQQVLQMETVKEVGRLRDENQKLLLQTKIQIVDDKVNIPTPEVVLDSEPVEQPPTHKKGFFARIFN